MWEFRFPIDQTKRSSDFRQCEILRFPQVSSRVQVAFGSNLEAVEYPDHSASVKLGIFGSSQPITLGFSPKSRNPPTSELSLRTGRFLDDFTTTSSKEFWGEFWFDLSESIEILRCKSFKWRY